MFGAGAVCMTEIEFILVSTLRSSLAPGMYFDRRVIKVAKEIGRAVTSFCLMELNSTSGI